MFEPARPEDPGPVTVESLQELCLVMTSSIDGRRTPGTSSLLRSKLRSPAVPDHFVSRPRLEQALADVISRPLTLVIAPAGSGKTIFLSSWLGHASVRTAWLSLEELDDDPVALWTGVIGALEPLAPGCGRAAQGLIAGGASAGDVVRVLLAGLEEVSPDDGVLVLDDVHHIKDPLTAESLALFVQHLPSWLHVVIAARTDPSIPLDRLRVRGQLVEVRFPELRFTRTEAREVLARLAPDLSECRDRRIRRVHRRLGCRCAAHRVVGQGRPDTDSALLAPRHPATRRGLRAP